MLTVIIFGYSTTAAGLVFMAVTLIGGSLLAFRWHEANVKKILNRRNPNEIHEVK